MANGQNKPKTHHQGNSGWAQRKGNCGSYETSETTETTETSATTVHHNKVNNNKAELSRAGSCAEGGRHREGSQARPQTERYSVYSVSGASKYDYNLLHLHSTKIETIPLKKKEQQRQRVASCGYTNLES